MVPRRGFEPPTPGLGILCSVLLSYRGILIGSCIQGCLIPTGFWFRRASAVHGNAERHRSKTGKIKSASQNAFAASKVQTHIAPSSNGAPLRRPTRAHWPSFAHSKASSSPAKICSRISALALVDPFSDSRYGPRYRTISARWDLVPDATRLRKSGSSTAMRGASPRRPRVRAGACRC